MRGALWWGRVLFAAAMAGLGIQALLTGDVVPGLEPLPATMAGREAWANVTGLWLVGSAAAILVDRWARFGALAVAGLMLLWFLVLHLPLLAADPRNGSEWTCLLEVLAIGGAAWALAGMLSRHRALSTAWSRVTAPGVRVGRFCYGAALPGFGILHVVYAAYVSAAIPDWIPGHGFWTYATGVAHIAAGLGILTGVLARPAATLLAVMFGCWVLILHAPRVAARFDNANEWTSLLIALAMSGGALIVAATFGAPAADPPARTGSR